MFPLGLWKTRNGGIKVRHDEPTRDFDRDDYPLARPRDEFESLIRFDWNSDVGWEDKGEEYVFHVDLPGFEAEDFDAKVSGKVLTVYAEHEDEMNAKRGRSSYRYGSFSRTFTLPHGVDGNEIDVRYHSGVLEVRLPKTEEACGRRIEVNSA